MYRKGYVYIVANKNRSALYTGVTSNLIRRIWQHKNKVTEGFSSQHNTVDLIYYEVYDLVVDAIKREKQIKNGTRASKEKLVDSMNPKRADLYEEICR